MLKQYSTPAWGEKIFLTYTSRLQFNIKGSQNRNLEAGAKPETMEEYFLLVCFPWLAQVPFKVPQSLKSAIIQKSKVFLKM